LARRGDRKPLILREFRLVKSAGSTFAAVGLVREFGLANQPSAASVGPAGIVRPWILA
jgi:hypothetical protein